MVVVSGFWQAYYGACSEKGEANFDLDYPDSSTAIGSSNRNGYRLRVPHHEQRQSSDQAGNQP